jgi:hypothetical protein
MGDLAIVARVVRRMTADLIGIPKDLLQEYEQAIEDLTLPSSQVQWAREEIQENIRRLPRSELVKPITPDYGKAEDLSYSAWFKVVRGGEKLTGPGHRLFLGILQTYTLPPALLKKVEACSRFYLKNPRPTKERGTNLFESAIKRLDIYEKYLGVVRGHLEIARAAIVKGKEHQEEGEAATKVRVGNFTVVNVGGFSGEVMKNVSEVIQKVEDKAQKAGFGNVCYGNVEISGTLKRSKDVAFYLVANDELYVRANLKPNHDSVKTTLHELGHRHCYKFLAGGKRAVERLYYKIKGDESDREIPPEMYPKKGDKMVSKGTTYVVTYLEGWGKQRKVNLVQEDVPTKRGHISLEAWLHNQGAFARDVTRPGFKGFVTEYARKGGPDENYAEMFAFYCLGKLPASQVELFEQTIKGTP